MKTSRRTLFAIIGVAVAIAGCRSIDTSIFGGSFGRNSSAMTAGGAVAGQDYVIGLRPSEKSQQYFASAALSSEGEPVTVTPGDDKGTGVTWTDDGGITIPPGVTIEFVNKGCCLDPHLPAPKADEEMQFIKTSCLIPTQLQGTYKNLLRRAAQGDEDVKSNLQHLMWTLRTAGSNDAYAKNLTDRQREILAECAEGGSFDGYCQDLHRFDELKKLVKTQVDQVADKLQVEIGNVTYKVTDLLDPELGKQKVAAHLGELIHMNEHLPVVHSGFNFGELQKGIYTDVKGNGTLSYKAKVANSTSEPFVFYPMDYVAQVGSGQNMQGAFFAAADSSMRQRTTTDLPDEVETEEKKDCSQWHRKKQRLIQQREQLLSEFTSLPKWLVKSCNNIHKFALMIGGFIPGVGTALAGEEMARDGIFDNREGNPEILITEGSSSMAGVAIDEIINGRNIADARWMRPEVGREISRAANQAGVLRVLSAVGAGVSAVDAYNERIRKDEMIERIYQAKEKLEREIRDLNGRRCPVCGGY